MSDQHWIDSDRSWSEYPIGTKARQGWKGGHWEKTNRGWKWCTGDTFPTPGSANQVMLPAIGLLDRDYEDIDKDLLGTDKITESHVKR